MLDLFVINNPNYHGVCPGGPFLRIAYPGDRSEFIKPKTLLSHWLNRKTLPKFYAKEQTTVDKYRISFETALAAAEKTDQTRLIEKNLDGLADLYSSEASFSRAEPLYERALSLRDHDKAFSSQDYQDLLKNLDSLATVLRIEGNDARAAQLEQRIRLLRHLQGNTSAKSHVAACNK